MRREEEIAREAMEAVEAMLDEPQVTGVQEISLQRVALYRNLMTPAVVWACVAALVGLTWLAATNGLLDRLVQAMSTHPKREC